MTSDRSRKDYLDALLWWAEAHRQNDLATSNPPASFSTVLADADPGSAAKPAWAERLFFERLELPYEARCLAVADDGNLVAVGTKAGTVHAIHLWDNHRHHLAFRDEKWDSDDFSSSRGVDHEAIRAITVIGRSTIIAGTSVGRFLVFELDEPTTPFEPKAIAVTSSSDPGSGWSNRFVRIVPLVPPGEEPVDGPIALGLTQGLQVHLLVRDAKTFQVETKKLESLLPTWPQQARLIDGGWARGRLWLLSSNGHVFHLRPDAGAQPLGFVAGGSMSIVFPTPGFEPRRLAACDAGLALLISEQLTFLRFSGDPESIDLRQPEDWIPVDRITDFALWQRVPKKDSGALVWLVAGSADHGLQWIHWPVSNPPSPAPPHLAACGDRSVLMAAFGTSAQGPTFLAVATRDHHLILTSILHKTKTRTGLGRLLPKLLKPEGPHHDVVFVPPDDTSDDPVSEVAGVNWRDLQARFQTPGLALWLLRARLYADLGIPRSDAALPKAWRDAKLLPMVQMLEIAQLRRLAKILIKRWPRTGHNDLDRVSIFRRWSLLLLRRAVYSAPADLPELARQLYDGIVGDHQYRARRALRPFAGFLRKWLINGKTYQTRDTNLLSRVLWNRRCGYDLDALVYLAKLTRRRFDTSWQVSAAPDDDSPIRDLVVEPSGRFSIQSHNDGRLTILSSDGRRLKWRASDEQHEQLAKVRLEISGSELGRLRRDADAFRETHRHGPYVRRLHLQPIDSDYLLLGCFRGSRRAADPDQLPPLFFAIRVRAEVANQGETVLRVVTVGIRRLASEVYDISFFGDGGDGAAASDLAIMRFVVGTQGRWRPAFNAPPIATPFVDLRVEVASDTIQIRPTALDVELDTRGQRTLFRGTTPVETAQNPCWSLAVVRGTKRDWIWAGFHDGRLRCFERRQRKNGSEHWIEGGGGGVDPRLKPSLDAPLDRSIKCSAAVWTVLYIEQEKLLAYGTADGVVGLVSMAELEEAPTTVPWVHLLHSRETAPICGLVSYRDEGQRRLLTLSQGGYATLYQLRSSKESASTRPGEPASAKSSGDAWRSDFPGLWKDRFPLNPSARAVQHLPQAGVKAFGHQVPVLLVGTGDGRIHRHELVVPRGSKRRVKAAAWQAKLLENERSAEIDAGAVATTPTLAASIGSGREGFFSWLRLLDTGGPEMVRFSFWAELRATGKKLKQQAQNGALDQGLKEDYLALVTRLGTEAFRRRPEGRDPSKILWEEAAGLANLITAAALAKPENAASLLAYCNEINDAVDDLCNRWIGSDQALEARVLIHSFNSFFDWTDLIILAWLEPPKEAAAPIETSCRYLLANACKRRLSYGEPMVRLETLRVINRTLVWAIAWAWSDTRSKSPIAIGLAPPDRPAEGQGGPSQVSKSGGLFGLLRLIGDLAARQHTALSPADPLSSEISRFFALTILLVPESALVVAHTMSESRLLDRGPELAAGIIALAETLKKTLPVPERNVRLQSGLDRFRAYCSPKLHFHADKTATDADETATEAWRLLTEPLDATKLVNDGVKRVTDDDFVVEQASILASARTLAQLEGEGKSAEESEGEGEDKGEVNDPLAWLRVKDRKLTYFPESYAALRHLLTVRKELEEVLGQDLAASLAGSTEPSASKAEQAATQLCETALRQLREADLFEPQRSLYGEIVRRWSEQIEKRARRAVAVLDAIDKFNRHIYRTSADRLMTRILELALQVAPLRFDGIDAAETRPLTHRIDEALKREHPLLAEIFRNGTDLVERTHLAGTLLELARYLIGRNQRKPELSYEVEISDIKREIRLRSKHEQIKENFQRDSIITLGERTPGTRAIWQTVVHEWAKNVRRHGCDPDRQDHKRLRARVLAEKGRRVLLISGVKAFAHCLKPSRQSELARIKSKDSTKAARWLRERAKETALPRPKDKLSPTSGTGLGLFLIHLICELVGVKASLGLCSLETDPAARHTTSADMLKWPLCLELSWPAPSTEERS